MEIKVKKAKEFKKGSMLSGKNVKLILDISVTLSEEEKELVQKYYDPSIPYTYELVKYYDGTAESYQRVKLDREESHVSNFKIVVHVDDGFTYLGNIQGVEKAVISALNDKISFLKALDAWEGDNTITG